MLPVLERTEHMIADAGQIAATTVTALAPFTPFLIEVGKAGGQKLTEMLAEKGGEAAWNKAQALWKKLKAHFGDDLEVTGALTMVSVKPEDENRQTILAEVLGVRLKEHPEIAEEIFNVLGGQQAVQQVLAERESWVEDVTQQIAGSSGSQTISARDNSVIKGAKQNIQHQASKLTDS
jgi:hypothetical protein